MNRRQILKGIASSALVVGFDTVARRWVRAAEASACAPCSVFAQVPPLDGALYTDAATLEAYSHDKGNVVRQTPCAVLRPGSVEDVRRMVEFCRRHALKVAARGQGHTMYGQSLSCGLVVDTGTLNAIHSIGPEGADVDSGVRWRELVEAAFAAGLTPPVLTGYIKLSIGGTLSVGGISSTNAEGAQVDRVRELEVVTGEGRVRRCSLSTRPDLFEAVLAGLGQCGIITRAKVDLVPAKPLVRNCVINYTDAAAFFRDLRTLLARGELNDVYNICFPFGTTLTYQIHAAVFYDPLSPPDNLRLMRGLSVPAALVPFTDFDYLAYVERVDTIYDTYSATMDWERKVKAWYDVWLPDSTVEQYVTEVIPKLAPDDVGPTGFVLLFPQRRSRMTRPFFRVPAPEAGSDWVYLFDILTDNVISGPDPSFAERMQQRNRRLFERARELGGTRYPIGVLPFTREDWSIQYGETWHEFVKRKRRYDPDNILTPGPGIF